MDQNRSNHHLVRVEALINEPSVNCRHYFANPIRVCTDDDKATSKDGQLRDLTTEYSPNSFQRVHIPT